MRAAVLAFTAALTMFVRPPDARACTCALPPLVIAPADTATGVPLDAVVTIQGADVTPVLQDADMMPVPATIERSTGWLVLVPDAPLAPLTTYTILPNGGDPTGAQPAARTFTTGDATATPALGPVPFSNVTSNVYELASCASSCVTASSGRASEIEFTLGAVPASTVILTATVTRERDHHVLAEVLVEPTTRSLGYELCSPQTPPLDPAERYCLQFTAYDIANHPGDAGTPSCFDVSTCSADACDETGLTCSAPVDPEEPADDGGCCGTSGTGAANLAPAALGLLALRRRRRVRDRA